MTTQYIAGELSLLLGELQALDRGDVRDLCRQAAGGAELMEFVCCANLIEESEGQQRVP